MSILRALKILNICIKNKIRIMTSKIHSQTVQRVSLCNTTWCLEKKNQIVAIAHDHHSRRHHYQSYWTPMAWKLTSIWTILVRIQPNYITPTFKPTIYEHSTRWAFKLKTEIYRSPNKRNRNRIQSEFKVFFGAQAKH